MIEKVIDEILAAELNAQNIVKEAGEKAADIRAAAAKDAEKLKNIRSEEFLKEAALKRAEAEKTRPCRGGQDSRKGAGRGRLNKGRRRRENSSRSLILLSKKCSAVFDNGCRRNV